jgi:hypothetical protein
MTNGLVQADKSEFEPNSMNRAIGGIQIASGEVCRDRGYLKSHEKAQQPKTPAKWDQTRDDVWFRLDLGTRGRGLNIPGVYRIRHSQAGRFNPELLL